MNDSPTVLVHAKGLRKDYGSGEGLVRALDAVDLDVTRGETLAIMGPSGCGKSTLLQLIGGLDRPSAGELSVAGQRVDQLSERALAHLRRDEIGFVFQAFHLMDELTAQENVELPALLAGCSPSDARARATALLEEVDLAYRVRHLPSMLSGGQRQRVAIARTGERSENRAGGRADRQLGQRCGIRRASALGGLAYQGLDLGDRHPRRAHRRHRGSFDFDARWRVRR
jgi:putative ABC transport system ATP-binding protein